MINRRFQDSNLKELVIVGEDLRPFIAQIYNQDLGCLKDLRVLKIERCQIDFFQPQNLCEKLKLISLEGNKIANLDVKFGCDMDNLDINDIDSEDEDDDQAYQKNMQLKDVKIEQLNLASNQFTEFPYR